MDVLNAKLFTRVCGGKTGYVRPRYLPTRLMSCSQQKARAAPQVENSALAAKGFLENFHDSATTLQASLNPCRIKDVLLTSRLRGAGPPVVRLRIEHLVRAGWLGIKKDQRTPRTLINDLVGNAIQKFKFLISTQGTTEESCHPDFRMSAWTKGRWSPSKSRSPRSSNPAKRIVVRYTIPYSITQPSNATNATPR